MQDFAAMIQFSAWLMQRDMTIWGFTFSFWDFLLWSIVASIILFVIGGFFHGR